VPLRRYIMKASLLVLQAATAAAQKCMAGEQFTQCGSPCFRTCCNPSPLCSKVCWARCECDYESGLLYNKEGTECVPQSQCSDVYDSCANITLLLNLPPSVQSPPPSPSPPLPLSVPVQMPPAPSPTAMPVPSPPSVQPPHQRTVDELEETVIIAVVVGSAAVVFIVVCAAALFLCRARLNLQLVGPAEEALAHSTDTEPTGLADPSLVSPSRWKETQMVGTFRLAGSSARQGPVAEAAELQRVKERLLVEIRTRATAARTTQEGSSCDSAAESNRGNSRSDKIEGLARIFRLSRTSGTLSSTRPDYEVSRLYEAALQEICHAAREAEVAAV